MTICFIFPFWHITVPEPQLDTYVICRTKGSLGALQLDNRQSIIFFGFLTVFLLNICSLTNWNLSILQRGRGSCGPWSWWSICCSLQVDKAPRLQWPNRVSVKNMEPAANRFSRSKWYPNCDIICILYALWLRDSVIREWNLSCDMNLLVAISAWISGCGYALYSSCEDTRTLWGFTCEGFVVELPHH